MHHNSERYTVSQPTKRLNKGSSRYGGGTAGSVESSNGGDDSFGGGQVNPKALQNLTKLNSVNENL